MLACNKMSNDHVDKCFVWFRGETRRQMPCNVNLKFSIYQWNSITIFLHALKEHIRFIKVCHSHSTLQFSFMSFFIRALFNSWLIPNYTPDWFQTFNFVQFYPWQTSIQALDISVFFPLILNFGFIQFDA
jgi:hypothetical protein